MKNKENEKNENLGSFGDTDNLDQNPEYLELKNKIRLLDKMYHQLDEEYDSYLKQISDLRARRKISANTECDYKD